MTGIAFAHDLLQIADEEARTRTVASMQRPAVFVPETKRGYELLREMQREKQHMRIVIDEYGGVSGLVTIEDLLEQIVGNIRDEHEDETPIEEPQREPDGVWLVPGSFPVDQLADLFGEPIDLGEDLRGHDAGRAGQRDRRPHSAARRSGDAGADRAAHGGCRSTDRRVERLRVFPPPSKRLTAESSPSYGFLGRLSAQRFWPRVLPRAPLLGRYLPDLRGQAAGDVILLSTPTMRMPCFSEMRLDAVLADGLGYAQDGEAERVEPVIVDPPQASLINP